MVNSDYIKRYLESSVTDDLSRKMVFIGGPRQSGKTTLAKHLCQLAGCDISNRYLNWDATADREKIIKESFPTGPGFLILDEIHKYSRWRQVVKGLFDKRGEELLILVTGSARLDYYRRGGDSLQGRYHFYRLLPLTYAELGGESQSTLKDLMVFGGFLHAVGTADPTLESGVPLKDNSGRSLRPGKCTESWYDRKLGNSSAGIGWLPALAKRLA